MKETTRQSIHLLGGLAITGYFLYFGKETALLTVLLLFLGTILLRFAAENAITIWPFNKVLELGERSKEKSSPFHAPMIFLLGTIFCLAFFQNQLAITAGLLVLSVGDSFSTLAGKKFGKILLTNRHTLEGTLAGILASSIALLLFLNPTQAIVVSAAGMLSELIGVEDNVIIPLASGTSLTLLL